MTATLVRRFGSFSRVGAEPDEIGEIEAVVVDDALGYVYYSDERSAIRKYHADPDHPDAARELAVIGDGYLGDREGLAIYQTGERPGFSCRAISARPAVGLSFTGARAQSRIPTITATCERWSPCRTVRTASKSHHGRCRDSRRAC